LETLTMKRTWFAWLLPAVLSMTAVWPSPAPGDEPPVKEGGWIKSKDDQLNVSVHTMEMTLHPQPEPRPALKYRLLPDEFEMRDGNAAVYYLKALGFIERDPQRERLREFRKTAQERAASEGRPFAEVPPHVWLTMRPDELPLYQMREYLSLTEFQPRLLAEAAKRRHFDMHRNLREVENPIGYLLPEIQAMRQLYWTQSIHCKVAIAESRIDDALSILGQQYALARHLGLDETIVSNLLGLACAAIAWDDALHLVQHPEAPNLYWAFASLPRPLIDMRYSAPFERQLLYLQLKVLREVDETPRPPGYWQDFLDRLIPQLGLMAEDFGKPWANKDPGTFRTILVGFVAAAYPGAKRYLIEELGIAREQVEAYPTAQVVFLAMVRFYDEMRDDYFKWTYLPFHQARLMSDKLESDTGNRAKRIGWSALPAHLLLPAISSLRDTMARLEQQLALLQAVEAIRMYGAAHEGKLPPSLDELPVPVPPEPFTGQPLDYQYHGDHAILNGYPLMDPRYRLILRFAVGWDSVPTN
jgi:hypothetical protein